MAIGLKLGVSKITYDLARAMEVGDGWSNSNSNFTLNFTINSNSNCKLNFNIIKALLDIESL